MFGIDFSHFDKGDYEFSLILIGFMFIAWKMYFSKLVRRNGLKPFLSREDHAAICKANMKELGELIDGKIENLKEFIELKVQNEILTEVRKNGKG